MNNHMMKKTSLPNICPNQNSVDKSHLKRIWKPQAKKSQVEDLCVPLMCLSPSQVNDFETKDFPENSSKNKPLGVGFNPPLQSCIKQNHFEGGFPLFFHRWFG